MQQYERLHQEIVAKNAAECTVLLKSDGAFPLDGVCNIDAFGAGMRYTIKGGTGSGEVNSRISYTIEESLKRAGFMITSSNWLDAYDKVRQAAKKDYIKQLRIEAKEKKENPVMYAMGKVMKEPYHELQLDKKSDVAIYVVSRNSGEGSDREVVEGDVKLSGSEVRDILAANAMYEKFMLVLNVGGVVDLSPVIEDILVVSEISTITL